MHEYDVQTTVQDLSRTFEEYKSVNNERIQSLENHKPVDALIEGKMARLEESLEKAERRLKQIEAYANRPAVEVTASTHGPIFADYLRKGMDGPLQAYEEKSLSTTNDPDGGYLVPPYLHQQMYATLQSTSVMRSLASRREISSSVLELLIDKESAAAGWVTEVQARPDTDTPQLSKIRIPVHEMYAKPRATQKLLDDALMNVEEWLAQKIAQKMAMMENEAFITGDGTNKPKGILSYETVNKKGWAWGKLEEIKTGVKGNFADGEGVNILQDAFFTLRPQYLGGASWLMARSAQATIRKLRDKDSGRYLWEPPLAGMTQPTLLGYPVHISDDMPPLVSGTASKSILFGNFKEGYHIVDRTGTRVLRDPYSAKPYVEFYVTRRLGGDVLNFEALKVINFSD